MLVFEWNLKAVKKAVCVLALLLFAVNSFSFMVNAADITKSEGRELAKQYGDRCSYDGVCNDVVSISCQVEVDGPQYYVHRDSLETVEVCGGACMGKDCSCVCPPKQWWDCVADQHREYLESKCQRNKQE